ncbi:MAG: RecX family transcriptional regulator [Bacteroidaceae bacterium]|nr:RecX family transcriptional regulator [Bacteroidaceae bacterium]
MKPLSPEQATRRAEARCAKQECCRYDLRMALLRWGVESEDAEQILDHLEKEGFIDESRYAHAFVHDKVHYDRWGKQKIQATLRQKKLSDSDIRTALDLVPETLYAQNLKAVIEAKIRTIGQDEISNDAYKTFQKLGRHAISKGYESDMVFRFLSDRPIEH